MIPLNHQFPHRGRPAGDHAGALDTSFLLEELRRSYRHQGDCLEVDFRSMVNWIRVGDQLTHQIHPYPAKLLPHIAHFFARSLPKTAVPDAILDPFSGSGTVALEASLAGCIPYVADANPLALLITKVKTSLYDPTVLRAQTRAVSERARRLRSAPQVAVVNGDKWYAGTTKRRLELLLRAVNELEDEDHRDFFRLCFSVAARRLSVSDPAISVPVRMRCKPTFSDSVNEKISKRLEWIDATNPIDEFFRICHANIDRIEATNLLHAARAPAQVVSHDARRLVHTSNGIGLADSSVPLIITSPPYGSAQKYIRASSLSLNWLGFAAPRDLSSLEGRSIGREHAPAYRELSVGDPLPDSFEQVIESIGEKNPLRATITRQYLHEMTCALQEMVRVTANGGRIVLVTGNNEVAGFPLRNDEFFKLILARYGCELELSLLDHIKSRGLLTKRNSTASVITRERIMVFRKS